MTESTQKYYATGKRKTSIARVWLTAGSGKFNINKRSLDDYFPRETLRMVIKEPLIRTNTNSAYDIVANICGGGIASQAGALRHGITKALLEIDSTTFRPILKKAGFITRDSRIKERKKYGQKAARKKFQYSKR